MIIPIKATFIIAVDFPILTQSKLLVYSLGPQKEGEMASERWRVSYFWLSRSLPSKTENRDLELQDPPRSSKWHSSSPKGS